MREQETPQRKRNLLSRRKILGLGVGGLAALGLAGIGGCFKDWFPPKEKSPQEGKTPAPPRVGGDGAPPPETTPPQTSPPEVIPTLEPNPWNEGIKFMEPLEVEWEGIKMRVTFGIDKRVSQEQKSPPLNRSFEEVELNPKNPEAGINLLKGVLFAFYLAWQEDNPQRLGVSYKTWEQWFKEGRDLTFYIGARNKPWGPGELNQPVDPQKALQNLVFYFFPTGGMFKMPPIGYNFEVIKDQEVDFQTLRLGIAPSSLENRYAPSDQLYLSNDASRGLSNVLLLLSLPEKMQIWAEKGDTIGKYYSSLIRSENAQRLDDLLAAGGSQAFKIENGQKVWDWERKDKGIVLKVK